MENQRRDLRRDQRDQRDGQDKLEEKVLLIRRVSKKTTGGNYVTFSALVVVGDKKGSVGIGIGRGLEVPPAIQKAIRYARKHMITIPIYKSSIPHQILLKYKSARVLLKPAPEGTGLKVGSVARIILDLAGVYNATGKIIGSRNQISNTYAIMEALRHLKKRHDVIKISPPTPEIKLIEAPKKKSKVESKKV